MKYYELDKEESNMLDDYEEGKFSSVRDLGEEKVFYESYAKNTLEKTKNINIRIPERVLLKLKSIAARKGMPYQTLVSSILHQFAAR